MPNVRVTADQFRLGELPQVCARTGAPAETSRDLVVVRRGAYGDMTVARKRMLGKGFSRITGPIPYTKAAARRTELIERVRNVLAGVAVVGFVLGLFTALWMLLAATALAILLGASLFLTVGGEIDRNGETVTLLHVHRDFVVAVLQAPRRKTP